jgi:hypothetical protein
VSGRSAGLWWPAYKETGEVGGGGSMRKKEKGAAAGHGVFSELGNMRSG